MAIRIYLWSINARYARLVPVSIRLARVEMSTSDTAGITHGQPRKRRPFLNAECYRRTCVDSDLEVRLPERTRSPFEVRMRVVSPLLSYS